jgi:uncharacterized membrane protein HdeD (DUF308 family)
MIRLVMLLIGARAVTRQWPMLPVLGALWMLLGVLLIGDISDGLLSVAIDTLGILLLAEGSAGLAGAFAMGMKSRAPLAGRAVAFVVLGLLVLVPFDHGIPDSALFGLAFLIDGCVRIASAYVVLFSQWRLAILAGIVELTLAGLVLTNWPLPHVYTVPFCLGVALLASGWSLVRLGLQLRRLPPGEPITHLPLFSSRPWHTRSTLPETARPPLCEQPEPLVLHVWTPVGSTTDPHRTLLVDRYIAAVDSKGKISTGHSALELKPDVYISHYPAVEIDHSPTDFTRMLRAGVENDMPGRWIASHAQEVADWCEPDAHVSFARYDAAALRAFWAIYREDNTYNLTSRSCSTAASLALESALEGVLGQRRPWLWFFLLLVDPNLWVAAILRRRGVTMAWTPGLVLDYARVLKGVVERQDQRWFSRLADAITSHRNSLTWRAR